MSEQIVAVSVVGEDRPGIVAEVTRALSDLHGNLEDSTMTLLRGRFAMILLVGTNASPQAVREALAPVAADGRLTVATTVLREPGGHRTGGTPYTLRVHGADRPGIVAAVTAVVARHGGNLVDLGTRLADGLYVLVAELELPPDGNAARLRRELAAVGQDLGVSVVLAAADADLL